MARAARVSQSTVSRLERGHVDSLSVATVRRVAHVLDVRVDLVPRWRGGDLERALNAVHNALHEALARQLKRYPQWEVRSEVSFSQFGERGVIDVLGWHARTRSLLVVELKSDLLDPGGLIAQVDRYGRLAPTIAAALGWRPSTTSCWVVVADTPGNRSRLSRHGMLLRGRFPVDGRSIPAWLQHPEARIEALSFHAVGAPRRQSRSTVRSSPVGRGSRTSTRPVSTR